MNFIQAIILAIVEGLTEFLPVSSTGHMIIASSMMGIAHLPITKIFTVAIQFGAILSVVVLYWKKFLPHDGNWNEKIQFYLKLIVGFIPAMVLGYLLSDTIDALLENVVVVAIMLLVGGILFIILDKWINSSEDKEEVNITYKKAFYIGLFQTIAMVPGVSRSAASIIGGIAQKLNKKQAAEFSFFLAVPTMFAATCKKMLDFYQEGLGLDTHNILLLVVGNLVAFVVAILAIKSFIKFLTKNGFFIFGIYRIVIGTIILVLHLLGIQLTIL
ncbi:MAG: undecaprenyl-diphosphate phosphatase [Chitinophagales bacterium]|nr:undecaprenyl-diphosphate phosphatase [Chitinophagales bacterium]